MNFIWLLEVSESLACKHPGLILYPNFRMTFLFQGVSSLVWPGHVYFWYNVAWYSYFENFEDEFMLYFLNWSLNEIEIFHHPSSLALWLA